MTVLLSLLAAAAEKAEPTSLPAAITERWPWVAPAIAIISGVIGWYAKHVVVKAKLAKLKAEVNSLRQEQVTEVGKTLTQVQSLRAKYNAKMIKCRQAAQALNDTIAVSPDDTDKIRFARNTLADCFSEETLPAFRNWVEWEHLARRQDEFLLESFIQHSVTSELRDFCDFVEIINSAPFINAGFARLEIKGPSCLPYTELMNGLSEDRRAAIGPLLNAVITKLRNV